MIPLLPIQHGSIVRYTCKAIYYESYKSSPVYLHFPNLTIYTFPYENSRPWGASGGLFPSLAASIGMGNLLYTLYSDEPFLTSLL